MQRHQQRLRVLYVICSIIQKRISMESKRNINACMVPPENHLHVLLQQEVRLRSTQENFFL